MSTTPSFTIPGDHETVIVNGNRYTRETRNVTAPVFPGAIDASAIDDGLFIRHDVGAWDALAVIEEIRADVDAWIAKLADSDAEPCSDQSMVAMRALAEMPHALGRQTLVKIMAAVEPKFRLALFLRAMPSAEFDSWMGIIDEANALRCADR